MGSVSQVRMKPGCVPTRYECQADRRKRTSNTTERPYVLKKQRLMVVEECQKDFEEKSVVTKHLETGETSSSSSGTYFIFKVYFFCLLVSLCTNKK